VSTRWHEGLRRHWTAKSGPEGRSKQCGDWGINWPRLEWALRAVCDAGRLGIIGTVPNFCRCLRACEATTR